MLDAIALERLGKPTVTIAHDTFETAARLHAKALGMPALPLLVEPAAVGGNLATDVADLARERLGEVAAALAVAPVPTGA